jgi:hypothetical protein
MTLFSWLRNRTATSASRHRPTAARFRAQLELLENRTLPSTFYAGTASDLINDINAANLQGGANTIVLTAPTTSPYVLAKVDNTADGPTVLPHIVSGNNLIIRAANPGYGDTLDASKDGRLFDVSQGGTLTLENVTLQNGRVSTSGQGVTEKGGAIYNQGTLILDDVMVQDNTAAGYAGAGQDAAGGGIWSNGSLTVQNATVFRCNTATGSNDLSLPRNGGNAFGGALCIAGGTARITNSFFGAFNQTKGNSATGGRGGSSSYRDGLDYGGALYVASGKVALGEDAVGNPPGAGGYSSNTAQAPNASPTGKGYGGGRKGTHAAVDRCQQFTRRFRYVLKADSQKFFPALDHEILKSRIARKIKDPDVLWLVRQIIDHSNPQEENLTCFPGDDLFTASERRRGIPIGNQTNQFFANVYLDALDHFVKDKLAIAGYVRYVDDFLVFANDKSQ